MKAVDLLVDRTDTSGTFQFPEFSAEIAKHFAAASDTHFTESEHYSLEGSTFLLEAVNVERDVAAYNARLGKHLGVLRDVSWRWRLAQQLVHMACHYPTGLEATVPARLDQSLPSISLHSRVERLAARCKCPEPTRLRTFLNSNEYLIDLVDEALRRLRDHFPKAHLMLSIEDDPDSYEPEKLVCFVRTQQDVEEAEAAYDKFRDEWWLDAKGTAEGRFSIFVEYE
jgi:hypothetical protein